MSKTCVIMVVKGSMSLQDMRRARNTGICVLEVNSLTDIKVLTQEPSIFAKSAKKLISELANYPTGHSLSREGAMAYIVKEITKQETV